MGEKRCGWQRHNVTIAMHRMGSSGGYTSIVDLIKSLSKHASRCLYRRIYDYVSVVDLSFGFRHWKKRDDISFHDASKENTATILRLLQPDKVKVFESRLQNSGGVVISHKETPAGYAWYTTASRVHEGARPFLYAVHPPPGTVYIYDVFIAAKYRNQGLAACLLSFLLNRLKIAGFKKAFLTASHPAMMLITNRIGFRIISVLTYERWLWNKKKDTSGLKQVSHENTYFHDISDLNNAP